MEKYNLLNNIFDQHENLRKTSINLLPSENVLSPLARKYLSGDMGQRYFFLDPFKTENGFSYEYNGTRYINEVLALGEKLANDIFNSSYASLYPLSGHQTNTALLMAFCKPGDNILCYDPKFGGYPGLERNKLPHFFGVNVHYFPVDQLIPEILDIEESIKLIHKIRPKVIFYSLAHTLFPLELKQLIDASKANDSIFVYDGSHPMGLIAGGEFQNPLQEGADFLIGGTQKSFPGPQGGIILTNNYQNQLNSVEHFVIVDNPHFHKIGALTVALAEMKVFGQEYARQVIKNTKHLAKCLHKFGLPVKYSDQGFTKSHMFKMDLFHEFYLFTKKLEKANIMIDSAGRIGTAEMTRLGVKQKDIEEIAKFIFRVFEGDNISKVRKDVIDFRSSFQNVKFTFSDFSY